MSDAPTASASGIAGAFTRKIGPLPGWAWVLIVVAIAYAVYYARKQSTTQAAPAPNPWESTSADYADLPPDLGGGANTTPSLTAQSGNVTNAQWARNTVQGLVASNEFDTTTANNAISKYLNGGALSPSEKAVVNIALARYGVPPEGVVPINESVTPDSRQGYYTYPAGGGTLWGVQTIKSDGTKSWQSISDQASANAINASGVPFNFLNYGDYVSKQTGTGGDGGGHRYTVRGRDTLENIAYRFYGDRSQWLRIAQANDLTGDTIHRGLVLTIPA